jgi:hypothetical protein
MIRSKIAVGFLFFLVLTVSASAQVYDTFVIPVVGSTSGANNLRWMTELSLFNPQAYSLKVSVTWLPTGLDNGAEVLVTVPSNTTLYTADVLGDFYHTIGTGGLLVATFKEDNPGVPDTILDRAFLVRTNTYNKTSNGIYGQAIPGEIAGMMDFDFEKVSAIATGINNWGSIGTSGFRTNIGALNLGRYSVSIYVNVYDAAGHTLAKDLRFDVPPLAHMQDRLPTTVQNGSIEFFVVDDDPAHSAVVFPYASIADNRTGDPIFVEPILLASPKYLYGNAGKMGSVSPLEVGKKIDSALARSIREKATRLGSFDYVDGKLVKE